MPAANVLTVMEHPHHHAHHPAWRVVVEGAEPPDLTTVEAVARLAVVARRMGWRLRLAPPTARLEELLELAGLCVEVGREPEGGEEPFGVE